MRERSRAEGATRQAEDALRLVDQERQARLTVEEELARLRAQLGVARPRDTSD